MKHGKQSASVQNLALTSKMSERKICEVREPWSHTQMKTMEAPGVVRKSRTVLIYRLRTELSRLNSSSTTATEKTEEERGGGTWLTPQEHTFSSSLYSGLGLQLPMPQLGPTGTECGRETEQGEKLSHREGTSVGKRKSCLPEV